MDKRYVVIMSDEDGKEIYTSVETSTQIIKTIDMFDCFSPKIYNVFNVTNDGELEKLEVFGVWHDIDDPLYIKATNNKGEIVFSGFGTDH